MFKKIVSAFLILFFLPVICFAQDSMGQEEIIEAKVMEIIGEREIEREDGSKNLQQDIKLKGSSGGWKDKEFIYKGISDFDVISSLKYEQGDKVLVNYHKDAAGEQVFYIVDYIRHKKLYWLALIFIVLVVFIARYKGMRALISLFVSFLIIMKFIIPRILAGNNPLLIAIIGSIIILSLVIYFTEGINRRSHLAILSILISLAVTGFIAIIFSGIAKLSGMAGEESMFLIGLTKNPINFKGLLLAGIMIGTLGVLDDVVISQLAAIEQIKKMDSSLPEQEVFRKVFSIGVSHISSMINTLFLAYAGASLPLLLLFSVKQPPFLTFSQILNNELIATEIVRSLVGSIGLILVVPIATYLGVKFLRHD